MEKDGISDLTENEDAVLSSVSMSDSGDGARFVLAAMSEGMKVFLDELT